MPKKKLQTQNINGDFKNKHILSIDQFDRPSLEKLFTLTKSIASPKNIKNYRNILRDKLAALLFFEPSTRTFSSFAAAVKRLGGRTLEYQNPLQTSSAVKGETLEDTIRVLENYCDL